MEIKNTTCCGVKEFSGLQKDPVEVVDYFCGYLFGVGQCAFILYTDPVEFENGDRLTDYISENNLGDVTETPVRNNPNSNRGLKGYLYAPDLKMLKAWYDKQPKPESFKKGDKIIGTGAGHYTITKRGWIGIVISTESPEGHGYIVVGDRTNNYDVEAKYFKLYEE